MDKILREYLLSLDIEWNESIYSQDQDAIAETFSSQTVARLEEARRWLREAERLDAINFHHPEFNAVFEDHRSPFWEISDAVALSFGKNPALITAEYVAVHSNAPSLFALYYGWLKEKIEKAHADNRLQMPLRPGMYVDWLHRRDDWGWPKFSPPPNISKAVPKQPNLKEEYRWLYEAQLEINRQLQARISALEAVVSKDQAKQARLHALVDSGSKTKQAATLMAVKILWPPHGLPPPALSAKDRLSLINKHLLTSGVSKTSETLVLRALRLVRASLT